MSGGSGYYACLHLQRVFFCKWFISGFFITFARRRRRCMAGISLLWAISKTVDTLPSPSITWPYIIAVAELPHSSGMLITCTVLRTYY